MFEFAYPWLLVLLALTPVLYLYLGRWKKPPSLTLSDAGLARTSRRRAFSPLPFLAALAFALLVAALARPRSGDERVLVRSQGIDVVLALDLSGSMEAVDLPDGIATLDELNQALASGRAMTRMEAARRELSRFIEERPNDRIGLVGFGELPYTYSPPTLDHAFVLAILERLQTGELRSGTNIAGAVATGVRRLAGSDAPRRVLVLFTDGVNNVESRLTPLQTAELAASKDVVLYTVGIGSENAVMQGRNFFGRSEWQPYRYEFDEALLREMAKIGNGRYLHADDAQGLKEVMDEIDRLEKVTFEQPKYIRYQEYAAGFILAALALLLMAALLEHTVCLRVP